MKKTFIFFALLCFTCFNSAAQNWEQVGLGAYGVGELYTDSINNFLYGRGNFKASSGDTIYGIAKYDGIEWDSMGVVPFGINAITIHNGELYAAGGIGVPGGIFVIKWNGISWDTIGGSFNNAILDLATYNNELYAVGFFSSAGGTFARNIARWDGVEWNALDTVTAFFFEPIWTAISYKNELYIGGSFYAVDTLNNDFNFIARWDGSNWRAVGSPIEAGTFGTPIVSAFAIYNDELYVAGDFRKTPSNGNPGNNIAKWDGNSWSDVGGGTNYVINDLVVHNGELYAVGYFTEAGGVQAKQIAKWNGTEWCGFGSTFYNGVIYTVEIFNDTLYVGGTFDNIDGYWIDYVAKWIGGSYTDTCGVLTGVKEEFEVKNGELKIYPNPTTGQINLTNLPQNSNARVTVYNVLGELVYDQPFINRQIDLAKLPDGIYMLQVEQGDTIHRKKIIKL